MYTTFVVVPCVMVAYNPLILCLRSNTIRNSVKDAVKTKFSEWSSGISRGSSSAATSSDNGKVVDRNRPNQEILVPDWLVTESHDQNKKFSELNSDWLFTCFGRFLF
eukprot:sb/3477721/